MNPIRYNKNNLKNDLFTTFTDSIEIGHFFFLLNMD